MCGVCVVWRGAVAWRGCVASGVPLLLWGTPLFPGGTPVKCSGPHLFKIGATLFTGVPWCFEGGLFVIGVCP